MNLLDVKDGSWVKLLDFQGGYGLECKLRQLGFTPGDQARVVRHAPFGGPMLVEVDGRAIAIGRGIASRIKVEESAAPCDLP